MRASWNIFLLLLTPALILPGCGSRTADGSRPEEHSAKLVVMVSIVPQVYFAQRLGGDLVEVQTITPPNYSPETYQVTPRQMDTLGRADIFFRIGMPFEEQLTIRLASTFPKLSVVDTREGVSLLSMTSDQGHGEHENEQEEGHHHHGDRDPHIWLDPMRVKQQARIMAEALKRRLPGQAEIFDRNLEAFDREMDDLHREVAEILKPVRGRVFYVFHPAFGYFADTFGLEQRAIEMEGKSPGPRRLYEIMNEIKNAGAKAIFEQPQFSVVELNAVAEETGVSVVLLDSLAEDYNANLKRMAQAVATYLK